MSEQDQLRTLLQVYMAEYSLYATLLLTGVLGALTVLLLWTTTKKGGRVFTVAYWILAVVSLFSFWRLVDYSRSVDVVLRRMDLIGLHMEIQGEYAFTYVFFSWILQNGIAIFTLIMSLGLLTFILLWKEAQSFSRTTSQVRQQDPQQLSQPQVQQVPIFMELILSKINTRESSTLTFATIAASASLVAMGLALDRSYPWWLPWIGITFAVFGIVYREITMRSTDRADYDLLPEFLRRVRERREAAFVRRLVIRLFLLLPIVAWIGLILNRLLLVALFEAILFSLILCIFDRY